MNKPYVESCDQNKQIIFDTIGPYIKGDVLEIGSGTGQHAVFFAGQVADVLWQTSERSENLAGVVSWINDSGLANLMPPIELDVLGEWPDAKYDLIYSANCFHIMGAEAVAASITEAGRRLKPGAVLAVYGPFNYNGEFTSASNQNFDSFLRARDPQSGIKDFEWIEKLASDAGMDLLQDVSMPTNNRTIIWQSRTL
jgi:SAM-dependent methyltransferase